jgi:hypothetical protein
VSHRFIRHHPLRPLIAVVILLQPFTLVHAQIPADATVILAGRPTHASEGSHDAATHAPVPAGDRDKLKVTIVKRGDKYFWASRENREVERRLSGAFHFYIDKTDGGYVRVFDRSTLPESMRPDGPQFEYTEHRPNWRGTQTLWGVLDTFED